MPLATPRRLAGAAIPVLALGLAACASDSSEGSNEEAPETLSPEEVVLASYEGLDGESYQMKSTITINGVDFMDMLQEVEGEATHASQDMHMSAMLEVMGEEMPQDPESAEMLEAMFSDMHTETILVDEVIYMQFSGGMLDSMVGQYGADAWFTASLSDLAGAGGLEGVYEQFGGLDLAAQTEALLTELADVEEAGDGVYTGTLSSDSEVMQQVMGAAAAGGDPRIQEVMEAAEVSITVDGDGLLESMSISFPDIEGMTMEMVSEIVEIGGDYDIAAPDSDNIHSFEDFAGSIQ
jgi:hypothetical protein